MIRTAAPLALLLLSGCMGPPGSSALRRPDLRGVISSSLPGVVLMLRRSPQGTIGYGSGLLLDEDCHVLTNLHVVSHGTWIGAMFHDPHRVSYVPEDGGLGRYLFENQAAIADAELLRGDPVLDLAVVKVAGSCSGYPLLPIAEHSPLQGEPVVALGHPQETVWSFTSGMVSSLHQGVIQHDAAINTGNSGGPLLDARGRVVGINTFKLLGGTEGIGFARPIGLAEGLTGLASAEVILDRSGPRQAFESCQRAAELASPAAAACTDWDGVADALLLAMERAIDAQPLSEDQRAGAKASAARSPALKPSALRAHLEGLLQGEQKERARLLASAWGALHLAAGGERPEAFELQEEGYAPDWDPALEASHGLRVDRANPRAFHELSRMGSRVDELWGLEADSSWLLVRGRNLDGSEYAYAQHMRQRGDGWTLSLAPSAEELEELPEGWPPPLSTQAGLVDALGASLQVAIEEPPPPPEVEPLPSGP
jgi:hypothetical protein